MANQTNKLQWVNQSIQSLLTGYGEYTFKNFKNKKIIGKEGISVFLMMAILLGDDDELAIYSSELYDFILNYEDGGHNIILEINENRLTSKSFKEMMVIFLLKFQEHILDTKLDNFKLLR